MRYNKYIFIIRYDNSGPDMKFPAGANILDILVVISQGQKSISEQQSVIGWIYRAKISYCRHAPDWLILVGQNPYLKSEQVPLVCKMSGKRVLGSFSQQNPRIRHFNWKKSKWKWWCDTQIYWTTQKMN